MAHFETVQSGVLIASVYTGFEPFVFSRGGELVGADVDILRGFCSLHGLALSLRPRDTFNGLWLDPALEEVDIAASGIARFTERVDPHIAWSNSYYEVSRSILIRQASAQRLKTIEDFATHTIGFVSGSTADLDSRARAPEFTHFRAVRDQQDGMHQLANGNIDGLAMGSPSNTFNTHQQQGFVLIDIHSFVQDEGLRFPLNAHNQELLSALNQYLAAGKASGAFETLFQRWLSQ